MTLYDLATVIRSKNAGPFTLTIDLVFSSATDMDRALRAPGLRARNIAQLYGVQENAVRIHKLAAACAVKVTMPRQASSGSAGDRDVYGSQQHMLLAGIRVPDDQTAAAALPGSRATTTSRLSCRVWKPRRCSSQARHRRH